MRNHRLASFAAALLLGVQAAAASAALAPAESRIVAAVDANRDANLALLKKG